jgi:hypothetical protein
MELASWFSSFVFVIVYFHERLTLMHAQTTLDSFIHVRTQFAKITVLILHTIYVGGNKQALVRMLMMNSSFRVRILNTLF